MAEELRGQAAEHLPPVVRMMAEAVTGGDVKALNKMMEKGELDPNKHLPLLFKAMRANAQPFMEQYFKTITFWQGKAQKSQEDWLKKFLGSGGTQALAGFYKTWNQVIGDSIPMAEKLGGIFKSMVHYFNAALLAPGEIMDWFNGTARGDNFMKAIFGDSADQSLADIREMFSTIASSFKSMIDSMTGDMTGLSTLMGAVGDLVGMVANAVKNLIRVLDAYTTGGFSGIQHELKRQDVERYYDGVARRELAASGMDYDERDVRKVREGYMMDWDSKYSAPSAPPDQSASASFGGMLSQGYQETKDLVNSGNFSMGALWDILNKDRSSGIVGNVPSNTPSIMSGPSDSTVTVRVIQDPLQVNAVVEARTDAEAVAQEVKARIEENDRRVTQGLLSNFPMTAQ